MGDEIECKGKPFSSRLREKLKSVFRVSIAVLDQLVRRK